MAARCALGVLAGMAVSDVGELKRTQDANARLKNLLAAHDLEIEVMKEIQAKKWWSHGCVKRWRNTLSPEGSHSYLTPEMVYFQRTPFRKCEHNPGLTLRGIPT